MDRLPWGSLLAKRSVTATRDSHKTVTRQSQDSHKTVTRQSQDSHKIVTRQSQDSHKTVTRQSQDRHKTVTRQSQDSHKTVTRQSQDSHLTITTVFALASLCHTTKVAKATKEGDIALRYCEHYLAKLCQCKHSLNDIILHLCCKCFNANEPNMKMILVTKILEQFRLDVIIL
jgi:hypothetical protein